MFIVVYKLPPKKIRCIFAAIVLALALLAALLFPRDSTAANAGIGDADITLCLDCLHRFGWEVDSLPVETETFLLSQQPGDSYLALQQAAGFDLRDDVGHEITRYTFTVTNYPTGERGILADIFLREGQVVGGDIRTSGINGFMHSLVMPM